MLERLEGNEYYFFLDGFSGYFRIPLNPQDQEKTTFTCPYGTFAYRRMPFSLCNAPGTFQRCMMAIFHDMIEKAMEVFMDDFSEKSHFMVKDGIVFSYKISKNGIEVDKAKVNVIAKLPHPTTVNGIQSFLDHAGFYRRFIQDFSKIARLMTRLLEKDTPFIFSKECIEAFQSLKKKLTKSPILVVPDWDLPFELMCDASDFAIVYMDHSALKYLFNKQDAKPRLLRLVVLLKNLISSSVIKKGAENLAADHLSRLENPHQTVLDKKEINETFPVETLNMVSFRGDCSTPWFIDFANYYAGNFVVKEISSQQKNKFFKDVKHYFGTTPSCLKCMRIESFGGVFTARKPLIFLRLATMNPLGDIMARTTPPKRSLTPVSIGPQSIVMPMTWSNIVTLVNVREKSVNVMKCLKMPSKFVRFLTYGALISWGHSRLHEGTSIYLWPSITYQNRFGTPRAIISDRGTHFCNDQFAKVMLKYGVTHRLATAYHPHTSGQVEVSNRGLKIMLERIEARTLPFACKFDLLTTGDDQKVQLNELNELRDQAYENSLIYKEKTKRIHDSKIKDRVFNVGDQVLLCNSRLKIFSSKLKTRWTGPFTITQVFPMAPSS
nr:reverse transcriptase domain-containing protein [Tanacetum cinerariifolium]